MTLLDENVNEHIQSIFHSDDPDYIAATYLEELNKAVKSLVEVKKVRKKTYKTPYWNKSLEA